MSLLETPDVDAGLGLYPVVRGAEQGLDGDTETVVLRPQSVPGQTLALLSEVVQEDLVQPVPLASSHLPPRLPEDLLAGGVEAEGRGQVLLQYEAPGLGEEETDDGGVEEGQPAGRTGAGGGMVQVRGRIVVVTDQVWRHREILLARQTHHAGVVSSFHLQENGGGQTVEIIELESKQTLRAVLSDSRTEARMN